MASKEQCCYLGRGKIYLKPYFCPEIPGEIDPNNYVFVGNTEGFSFTPNVNEIEKKDYTSCAGGTECFFQEIEGVDLSIITSCHSPENLKAAFAGENTEVVAGAVVAEPHAIQTVGADTILLLDSVYDEAAADLVVTNTDTGAPLVEGVDYVYEKGTVTILAAAALPAGTNIALDYTSRAVTCTEGLLRPSSEFTIRYIGENCANERESYNVSFFRVRLNSQDEFNFIGDEFNTITLSGRVLRDEQKVGAGISKFLKLTVAV